MYTPLVILIFVTLKLVISGKQILYLINEVIFFRITNVCIYYYIEVYALKNKNYWKLGGEM